MFGIKALHASGAVQLPHSRSPPQPSAAGPQLSPSPAQVFGVHMVPQAPGTPPPPQVRGAVQVPQSSMLPQLSPAGPQVMPWLAQVVVGTHTPWPQTFGVPGLPPPQVWGRVQVPQSSMPPQPSPLVPQLTPSAMQVVGTHEVPQTLGTGGVPAPHTWFPVHMPHMRMPPQPSLIDPQLAFCAAQVVAVGHLGPASAPPPPFPPPFPPPSFAPVPDEKTPLEPPPPMAPVVVLVAWVPVVNMEPPAPVFVPVEPPHDMTATA